MRLVDNLYAYVWRGSDNNSNAYVFADTLSDHRHVIIDPGHVTTPSFHEEGLETLEKDMQADGLDARSIGMVILTHAHPDHCEAAVAIRQKYNALVGLHEADEPMFQRFGGTVDFYLEEGELELTGDNKTKLQIYHSPGHSPGHITIYWPKNKVLIAGDVIFYQSHGRVDLPGGSARLLKESIERLAELDIEYLLCGHPYGHPGIIQGKEAVQQNFDFLKKYVLF